jgi:hypothetical protein
VWRPTQIQNCTRKACPINPVQPKLNGSFPFPLSTLQARLWPHAHPAFNRSEWTQPVVALLPTLARLELAGAGALPGVFCADGQRWLDADIQVDAAAMAEVGEPRGRGARGGMGGASNAAKRRGRPPGAEDALHLGCYPEPQ